jgi:hypothetical protein
MEHKMTGPIRDFKDLIENTKDDQLFVDKTLLIKEVIHYSKNPLLITRPRRWGKSLNMSMLFYFLIHRDQLRAMKSDTYAQQCDALYEGRNIFNPILNPEWKTTKQNMGQYPAILMSFALSGDSSNDHDCTKHDWGKIKGLIIGQIAALFSDLRYLADDLRTRVSKYIHEHFDRELTHRIQKYKQQFNTDHIPVDMQTKIYEAVCADVQGNDIKRHLQEQKDLEKFERLRDGEPKDEGELSDSINFLASLLSKQHGQPTCIFIDEYDSLINKYFDNPKILSNLTQTLSGLFSAFAKPNRSMNHHLKFIIFTGILRVAKANIFSELNNLKECTVFDKTFGAHYGFTTEEICELLTKINKNTSLPEVEKWYNGYKIGGQTIYNPWSVMHFIESGEFDTYWINTARPGLIKDIIINNKGHIINNQLRDIIKNGTDKSLCVEANKSVSVEDLKDPKSIWSFLVHTGYLTMDTVQRNVRTGKLKCSVRIPNTEILCIYNAIVSDWLAQNAAITGAITNVFEQDYEGLADNLQIMLENKYSSALFARSENSVEEVYHSLLLSELNKEASMAQYALLPEHHTGQGRADILFIDNTHKIVVPIELKRAHHLKNLQASAEEAVKQAINKKYGEDAKYAEYTRHPAIGMSFFGINLVIKVAGSHKIIERILDA